MHSQTSIRTIRVLHYPIDKNPYQKLLFDALKLHDVEIVNVEKVMERFDRHSIRHYLPLIYLVSLSGGIDILHLHWVYNWLAILPTDRKIRKLFYSIRFLAEIAWLRLRGVKIVWTVHNLHGHESMWISYELFFRRLLARLCNALIVHCSSAREEVIATYKLASSKNVISIPQGNYISVYGTPPDRNVARNSLGLSPDSFVFLFFGNVRHYKGVIDLIDAFKSLDDPNAFLIIAGNCHSENLRNQLQDSSRDDPRLKLDLRFLPDNLLPIYMAAADVVVLPFRRILNSSSTVLAMGYKKTIIAPRLSCLPELLASPGNLLFTPNDQNSLMQALQQATQLNLVKIGERNYEAAQALDWSGIAAKTHSVYEECMTTLSSP